MAHFILIAKLPSAAEMGELLVQHVFRLHRLPQDIVSDRCRQFTLQVWRSFCAQLGATGSLTSGHHPESNGQVERMNQSLESTLRCVTARHPTAWSLWLPWVEYAHNSLMSAATCCSWPCSATSHRCSNSGPISASLHPDSGRGSGDRYVQQTQLWSNRRRRASPAYVVGLWVWLSIKDLPSQKNSRKLAPRYVGPFEIVRVVNPVAVCLSVARIDEGPPDISHLPD